MKRGQDSWETTEIINFMSHGAAWPFEPAPNTPLTDVATSLRESTEVKGEGPLELYASFGRGGGEWRNVDWRKLASCMKADFAQQ